MILLTQAALHAAIVQVRDRVLACTTPEAAGTAAFLGLETLAALLNPAHTPAPLPDPHPATGERPCISGGSDAGRGGESTQDSPNPGEGGELPGKRHARTPRGGARPASLDRPSPWNAGRDAHLAAAWARGDTVADILAAINAMPGEGQVPSELAIRSRVSARKLRRGKDAMAAVHARHAARASKLRKWTEAAIAFVRDRYPDKTIAVEDIAAEVSKILGQTITADSVAHFAQKNGIVRPRGQVAGRPNPGGKRNLARWSDERRNALRALWGQHPRLTQTEIAAQLNGMEGEPLSPHAVGVYALSAMQLPPRGALPRVDGREPAAAAAPGRATGAPPAPEAAPAAPPTSPIPAGSLAAPAAEAPQSEASRARSGQDAREAGQQEDARHDAAREGVASPSRATQPTPEARANRAPAADDAPPPYDAASPGSREAKIEKALRLLRAGKDVADVKAQTKLEAHVIQRLVGQVRMEGAGA